MVAGLAVEMEEERRARLEKMVATKRLRVAMEMDEERKARLEKMITTTQLRLALETEEERRAKKWIGYDLDLIWIEIGVLISRNELARPVMGTIFLVYICLRTKIYFELYFSDRLTFSNICGTLVDYLYHCVLQKCFPH